MKHIKKFLIRYDKEQQNDYYVHPFPFPHIVASKINELIDKVERVEYKLEKQLAVKKTENDTI